MARKIEFKDTSIQLNVGDQVFNQSNITEHIYDYLVSLAPVHADYFNVTVIEDEKKPFKVEKPVKEDK